MYIVNQDQRILYSGESKHVTNNLNLLYDKVKVKETMDMDNETLYTIPKLKHLLVLNNTTLIFYERN